MTEYNISINGKKSRVKTPLITYADVLKMSALNGKKHLVSYTIHPRFNSGKKFIETSLMQGDVIRTQEGMSFTIKINQ
jgi:hypothetical protein